MKRFTRMSVASIIGMFLLMLTVGLAQAGGAMPLEAPDGAAGHGHNDEGIEHYNKGHWDKAETHFNEAIKENGKLAEAHYNLALSLDKQSRHREATKHFRCAQDLGKDNPAITGSKILKKHLGM